MRSEATKQKKEKKKKKKKRAEVSPRKDVSEKFRAKDSP